MALLFTAAVAAGAAAAASSASSSAATMQPWSSASALASRSTTLAFASLSTVPPIHRPTICPSSSLSECSKRGMMVDRRIRHSCRLCRRSRLGSDGTMATTTTTTTMNLLLLRSSPSSFSSEPDQGEKKKKERGELGEIKGTDFGWSVWEKMAISLSGKDLGIDPSYSSLSFSVAAVEAVAARRITPEEKREITQLATLLRVGVPSLGAGLVASAAFPTIALIIASLVSDAGALAVLSQDSSQFVQNFLTVSSLLFSILVGQTYYFMYQQQEAMFYALFAEVTEAKSLLEQVALVCKGRAMYNQVLRSIATYVRDDLKRLDADPAVLLSSRPADDPLESVMYMTSVGVPGAVYDTVRSLRQARAARLGALQRKLPRAHMNLLWLLAAIELCSFPLLGAGTQTLGGYDILTVEGCLFGFMTVGIVMTLRVVGELWRPAGGAYNVDAVLSVMVRGLEDELSERLSGRRNNVRSPFPQYRTPEEEDVVLRVMAAHSVGGGVGGDGGMDKAE